MIQKEEALRALPYWERLPTAQREFVAAHAAIRQYAKGEIVHGYGNACLGTVQVLCGSLRVYLLSEEGREITLFRLEEGEPCVLSAACVMRQITFDTYMVAESDCRLLVVSAAAFDRVAEENIYVKCFMYEVAAERFSAVMRAMQQILFCGLDKRLASFLTEMYEKTGSKRIDMTQSGIAVQISSAREAVARTLKRFEEEGLVRLSRGRVVLLDVEGLKKIG